MIQYLDLLQRVALNGNSKGDRTGTGTTSLFGTMTKYDLQNGFPVVTTKKLHLRAIIHELLWFLSGSTNIKYLQDNDVHIWDEWADAKGDLGPTYGYQWRKWTDSGCFREIDQISEVIEQIKTNPNSRRLIVSAWNVADINAMKLPPCHLMFQFYVNDGKLSCMLTQRSADLFLGVPFNIASYALLTHMIAQVCNLEVGTFTHSIGDAHIYSNHRDQVDLQLRRMPYFLPRLKLNPAIRSIFDFTYDDIELIGYKHHPAIKAPVAV